MSASSHIKYTLYVFIADINIGMLNLFASGTSESYFSSRGVLNGKNFPGRKRINLIDCNSPNIGINYILILLNTPGLLLLFTKGAVWDRELCYA